MPEFCSRSSLDVVPVLFVNSVFDVHTKVLTRNITCRVRGLGLTPGTP